jgi:thymidylate synthase ThyX
MPKANGHAPYDEIVFNYGEINNDHKDAVAEVMNILRTMQLDDIAEMLKYKFKIEELPIFDPTKTRFWQLAKKYGINIASGGYTLENGVKYPYCTLDADIRVLEDFVDKIREDRSYD